nr:hypothetical protein [Desulfobacterales bacterium]
MRSKLLGFIDKAASNLYRDPQLKIAGVGSKVRQPIDEHIIAEGMDPKIPPVSTLDRDFEKEVGSIESKKPQTREMEYAIKHVLKKTSMKTRPFTRNSASG